MGWRDAEVRGENENLAFADSFGRPSTQTHNKEFFKSSFDNEHATYQLSLLNPSFYTILCYCDCEWDATNCIFLY